MLYLILLLMIATTPLAADPPAFPPSLEQYLMLEPGDADTIVAMHEDFKDDVAPLVEQLVELKRQIVAETLEETPDAGLLGTLMVDIEMLRRDIEAERNELQTDIETQVLTTPQQQQRLPALERARRLLPLYKRALRFNLVDRIRQMRRERGEQEDPPVE